MTTNTITEAKLSPTLGDTALTPNDIEACLTELPKWKVVDGALQRIHTCHEYLDSLELLYQIGQLAEHHDHHPDLMLNYKRLTIRYWTFRSKGITALDVEMAKRVEALILTAS